MNQQNAFRLASDPAFEGVEPFGAGRLPVSDLPCPTSDDGPMVSEDFLDSPFSGIGALVTGQVDAAAVRATFGRSPSPVR